MDVFAKNIDIENGGLTSKKLVILTKVSAKILPLVYDFLKNRFNFLKENFFMIPLMYKLAIFGEVFIMVQFFVCHAL